MRRASTRALLDDDRPLLPIKASMPPLELSPPKGYELAKQDRYPVPVLTIGSRLFVRRSDLLKYLGIEDRIAG